MRSGVAFFVFGAGALVLTFLVIPVARRLPSRHTDPTIGVQRVVHYAFRLFEWFVTVLGLIRVTRVGMDRIPRHGPCLLIANHPTLIDFVLLVASLPQADCVVKKAASGNAYLQGVVEAAGYVLNDEGEKLVDACVGRLRMGRTILLFPEGTRSPLGRIGSLHRGAAHIALRSGAPLLPVVITCEPRFLMKGQKWYEVPPSTAHLTIRVDEPIDSRVHHVAGAEAIAARRLTAAIRDRYGQRLCLVP